MSFPSRGSLRITSRGGQRSYYEHDDRGGPPSDNWRGRGDWRDRGRGGFREGGRGGRYGRGGDRYQSDSSDGDRWTRGTGRRGGGGPTSRSRLEDDDISMGGQDNRSNRGTRFNPYDTRKRGYTRGRRPNNSRGRQFYNRRQGSDQPMTDSSWCKVIIPLAAQNEKEWLLKTLQTFTAIVFTPVQFHFENQSAVFYVDNRQVGDSLRGANQRVTSRTGQQLRIIVKNCGPPSSAARGQTMSEEEIQLLKETMSKRYDSSSKLLDLKDMYNDEDLNTKNVRVSLGKSVPAKAVLDIIGENIPEVLGIDFSCNLLYSLYELKNLAKKAPNVKSLNFSKNKLKTLKELDGFKSLPLEELLLDENPLCDFYKEKTEYISAVRKLFPKVVKLDGHDLPPPIIFDLETPTTLPTIGPSFFGSDQVRNTILAFCESYYRIYDLDSRQGLLDFYHDQARFSMSLPYQEGKNYPDSNLRNLLGDLFQHSRNFKKTSYGAARNRSLKQGKLSVVAFLDALPKTQHDPNSFVFDVSLAQSGLLNFTINGVYKDVKTKQDKVIAFTRVFLIAGGPGFIILNDSLCLHVPTEKQRKTAFSTPAPTPTNSPVDVSPSSSASLVPPQLSEEQKQQMILQFTTDSGMNVEWSKQCLQENNWDYSTAGQRFLELKEGGKIPPEAFI